MHRLGFALGLVIAAAVPAASLAAPAALPPVKRTLSAAQTGKATCHTRAAKGRAAGRTTYRAPMSGFLTVRGDGRTGGNWDLALLDARTGRALSASQGFGSGEVAQTWVGAGQRITIKGCRKSGRDSTFPVSINFIDAKPPAPSKPSLVRVETTDDGILQRLESLGFDVTHHERDGHTDVIAPSADKLSFLKKSNLDFTVRSADLRRDYLRARQADARFKKRVGKSALPSGRTTYRAYADYQKELVDMASGNPGLVKPVLLGKSFQGRNIEGVEIAHDVNRADDGRPTYLLVALHHAREWPSAEIAMEFAHMLVDGYKGGDAKIGDLLRRERIVVVPIINPDGFVAARGTNPDPADTMFANGLGLVQNYDKVLGALDEGRPFGLAPYDWDTIEGVFLPFGGNLAYRRKNCNASFHSVQAPSHEQERNLPCYYKSGVDPNRNYGYGWGGPGGSTDPTTQSYRGTGQWSEPETQAVWKWSQKRNVSMLITLHNVAALVLRPPGVHTEGLAPDEERMKEIGGRMAESTGYLNQYGWELYDTTGGTEDWTYGGQGSFGFTIEIGPAGGKFHMPYETGVVREWEGFDGREGRGMREALLVAAESAANPGDHSVVQGNATPGSVLRLKKTFDTFSSPLCTWAQGNFVSGSIVSPLDCVAPGARVKTADGVEYTTVVPADGRFEWHVPPSTRPFVWRKVTPGTMETTPYDTTTWSAEPGDVRPDRTFDDPNNEADEATYAAERRFTVAEAGTRLKIDLTWGIPPQDFDLKLYHVEPDGSLKPAGRGHTPTSGGSGSSGNANGLAEGITVDDAELGDYLVRVIYYMTGADRDARGNDWKLTLQRFRKAPDKVEQGRETYTLTCERPDGTVLETADVYVERGQAVTADICAPAQPAPADQGGEEQPAQGEPAPEQAVLGDRAGSSPRPNAGAGAGAKAGAKPKSTTRAKKRAACLKKAKRVRGKAKRKRAVARCNKRYAVKKKRAPAKRQARR